MATAHASGEASVLDGLSVNLQSIRLTDEQFYRLCEDNPELRLELTARGALIVMSPTGSRTGLRNSRLTTQLGKLGPEARTRRGIRLFDRILASERCQTVSRRVLGTDRALGRADR